MANKEIMMLGAGMMIGAGTPSLLRQEKSMLQWSLFLGGAVIALVGTVL